MEKSICKISFGESINVNRSIQYTFMGKLNKILSKIVEICSDNIDFYFYIEKCAQSLMIAL